MSESSIKIAKLAAFLKKNPTDSFSKFALALELLKLDEVSKSRVLFESILRQDPDYLGVYYHLGKLYEQLGLLQQAKRLYESGITVSIKQNNSRTESELKDALELLKIELKHEE
jgi:tetratricopeptide (TPR) repeat protein